MSQAQVALALASTKTSQEFESALLALRADGHDLAALLKWGKHYVPRTITNPWDRSEDGMGYFHVLHKHNLMTADMVFSCLLRLSHRCKYGFFRALFELFPLGSKNRLNLAVLMAYFNDSHSCIEIEDRIALMTKLGLLDLSDQRSVATEAMMNGILQRSLNMRDVNFAKMFVYRGYPADGSDSSFLRLMPCISDSPADAEFFISRGARLDAGGYLVIFTALAAGYQSLARYLFKLASAEEDPETIKAMLALHSEHNEEKIDFSLLVDPA